MTERQKLGLCTDCGDAPAVAGTGMCEQCLADQEAGRD
jgi:NMD protein affecting ribosome stability and mRNA decay